MDILIEDADLCPRYAGAMADVTVADSPSWLQARLRAAVRAWIAMVEGTSLDWIAPPELERNQLCELLMAGYFAMLHKAVDIDPKAAGATSIKPRGH